MPSRKPESDARKRGGKRAKPDRSHRVGRKSDQDIVIYGFHAVREALGNPARTNRRLLATRNGAQKLETALRQSKIPVDIVDPAIIDTRLPADTVHQGALLETRPLPSATLEDIAPRGPVMLLDQVTDPQNFGAIMRTACAFGASALVVTERRAPRPSGALAKAASGTLEYLPYIQVTNLARAIDFLNERGYQTIGLTGDAERDLHDVVDQGQNPRPRALVMGAEGKGIRDLTAKTCTDLARLRLTGPITTLNVSAAAAVALQIACANAETP